MFPCISVLHKRGLYSNMWQRYINFSTSTRNHNAKLRLFFHPAAACPESRNFTFLPVVTKFSSSWLQNSGPLREVLTFGRHCSRSAMLAVAFLGRDSAITKQAQMALAAPSVDFVFLLFARHNRSKLHSALSHASVQASSVLLSLNRSVNCYLETDKVARFFLLRVEV